MFDLPKDMTSIIKVIGVGGGGSNAVNYMYNQGIKGVDFIICNTDRQALDISPVPFKIQLGKALTEGRGAGMLPEVGMNAAFENIDELRELLSKDTKMVFVTAGMGGGTGTGAAPVIAQIAKELGILTVGIVTIPFDFEGRKRRTQADEGLERMRQNVDTLLVINNEKLRVIGRSLSLSQAFEQADSILSVAAKGIAEVISVTGLINVDFNDVNTVLRNSGHAIMGSAIAEGENRALDAVKSALNSPLLNEDDIHGANYVLLNITYGSKEVMMDEIIQITDFIQDAAGATADVIWGHGYDEALGENLSITIIATGFASQMSTPSAIPERKLMNLNAETTNEIVAPLTSPFEVPQTMTEALLQEPFLKNEEDEITFEVEKNDTSDSLSTSNEEFVIKQDVVNEEEKPTKVSFDLFDSYETNEEVSDEVSNEVSSDVEWELEQYQSEFEVKNEVVPNLEPTVDNIEETPINEVQEPEIIRHVLVDELEEKANNYKIQSTVLPEEIIRRNEERVSKIQDLTSRIQNVDNISDYENEPAYLRRNLNIKSETPSKDDSVSKFGLSNDSSGSGLRNNSFLHDNVD